MRGSWSDLSFRNLKSLLQIVGRQSVPIRVRAWEMPTGSLARMTCALAGQRARGSRPRQSERGNQRRTSEVPGRIVHLFEVQLDSVCEVNEGFVDRVALAGNVDL